MRYAVWWALVGCASEEQIQARWESFLDENTSCEVAEDCALVSPGCPLGCATAVRADAVDEAEELAARLIRQYEAGGRSCAYDCVAFEGVTCDAGRCALVPDQNGD